MRRALGWTGLLVAVTAVALVVAAPQPRSNRPNDPGAAGPAGAKALVVLLEELGAEVEVTPSVLRDGDTAVLLEDRLDDAARDDLRAWVHAGGVLVVADISSPLAPIGAEGRCPAALAGVDTLQLSPGPTGRALRGDGCFDGLVRSVGLGDGDIVVVLSTGPFTNDLLDEEDNAALAAALLAPTGSERVAFLRGTAGSGDRSLADLLSPSVTEALLQAGIAAVVYVLWRGRRLGRPVPEGQPVAVAGSDLVSAVGRMLAGRRRPADAATTLRTELLRSLEHRLGLPAGAPVEQLATAVGARTGLDPTWVAGALAARPVTTDDDLVALAADLDRIRDETLQPTGGARP
jgi:hypothetical protein